jgi:hypothetical protein
VSCRIGPLATDIATTSAPRWRPWHRIERERRLSKKRAAGIAAKSEEFLKAGGKLYVDAAE